MNKQFLWALLFFIGTIWMMVDQMCPSWCIGMTGCALGLSLSDWEKTGFKIFNK
jgi:hypothetical protein